MCHCDSLCIKLSTYIAQSSVHVNSSNNDSHSLHFIKKSFGWHDPIGASGGSHYELGRPLWPTATHRVRETKAKDASQSQQQHIVLHSKYTCYTVHGSMAQQGIPFGPVLHGWNIRLSNPEFQGVSEVLKAQLKEEGEKLSWGNRSRLGAFCEQHDWQTRAQRTNSTGVGSAALGPLKSSNKPPSYSHLISNPLIGWDRHLKWGKYGSLTEQETCMEGSNIYSCQTRFKFAYMLPNVYRGESLQLSGHLCIYACSDGSSCYTYIVSFLAYGRAEVERVSNHGRNRSLETS